MECLELSFFQYVVLFVSDMCAHDRICEYQERYVSYIEGTIMKILVNEYAYKQ